MSVRVVDLLSRRTGLGHHDDTPLLSGERALVVGRTRTCCLDAMLEASGIQECIMISPFAGHQ